jgi:hypothetical protein
MTKNARPALINAGPALALSHRSHKTYAEQPERSRFWDRARRGNRLEAVGYSAVIFIAPTMSP